MMRKTQRQRLEGFPLDSEPGWIGAFTREQVPGAIPNGSPIVKTGSEQGDGTPDGTPGVVLGSMSHPEILNGATMYFVEWRRTPRCAVAVIEWKVSRV